MFVVFFSVNDEFKIVGVAREIFPIVPICKMLTEGFDVRPGESDNNLITNNVDSQGRISFHSLGMVSQSIVCHIRISWDVSRSMTNAR